MTNCIRIAIVASVLVGVPFASHARLGETENESQRRYGAPVTPSVDKMSPVLPGAVSRTYDHKGWRVRAAFVNGRAVKLTYQKKSAPGVNHQIQDDEAAAILASEKGTGEWRRQSNVSLNPIKALSTSITQPERWVHTNGSVAYIQIGHAELIVESPAASAFVEAGERQQEEQRKASIPAF